MYVDALTISAVADELRAGVLNGRVQGVMAVDSLSIGLEIYANSRRQYLFMSADPRLARVHLAGQRLRRGVDTPTPLLLLLRKWVRGARLAAIQQPAFERILRLEFEHPEGGSSALIIECMGRHSNIILVDAENMIMESIKRVGSDVNRYRVILPRQPYVPPPPQKKLPPDQISELRLREIIEAGQSEGPAWKALVAGLQGISPLMAREASHRAWDDSQIPCGAVERIEPILSVLQGMIAPLRDATWEPSVAYSDGDGKEDVESTAVACFAPYSLTHYARWEQVKSISEAIEHWVAAGKKQEDTYKVARSRLQVIVDDAIKRVTRRQGQLREQMKSLDDLESLRLNGELILAYGWNLHQGQTELIVDIGNGSPSRTIRVDPALSPAENAQHYFTRYGKAKRAHDEIPPLLRKADLEIDKLRQIALDLQFAENRAEIDEIEAELIEAGYKRGKVRKRARKATSLPLSFTAPDGATILVGRNSRQNDRLTFKMASGNDLWFHARGIAGAHVILRTAGQEPSEESIQRAAELAAYYSAGRLDARVLVDYTLRRFVRRQRGGAAGQVFYRHEQSRTVQPKS